MQRRRFRVRPGTVIAVIALFAATSGAAIALPGRNSVDSGDIKRNAVRSGDIKNRNVKNADLAPNAVSGGKVRANTLRGGDVAAGSLNDSDLSDFEALETVRVVATEGATEAAARAAAPETALFTKGALTFYAKCFRHTDTNTLRGAIYTRTTQNGVIQQGTDILDGSPAFLDTTTLEEDRELDDDDVANNSATIGEAESIVAAPGGPALFFDSWIALRNGVVAGGDGIYGTGNVCLFGGQITG
jgi:hypothetical protein